MKPLFVAAIFDSHPDADHAVKALQSSDVDMRHVSVAGHDFHTDPRPLGFYSLGGAVHFCGRGDAWWSRLSLLGDAAVFLTSTGPLVMMGPLVRAVTPLLDHAVRDVRVPLARALGSMGMSSRSGASYASDVGIGKFLLVAHGTARDAREGRRVLGMTGASQLMARTM